MAEKGEQRRLAAILVADVVGYSRLMEADEAGTLAALRDRRKTILEPVLKSHGGRIVKVMGDGVLVEFASAVNSVKAGLKLQEQFAKANESVPEDQRIVLRIGVNLGDVIGEENDIYGEGINIAARLEALADPGGIAVSGTLHDHVAGKLNVAFVDGGEQTLKNIQKPVRVFHTASSSKDAAPSALARGRASIAVLPFTNMSSDPEQEFFADGLTEDLITDLSKVSGVVVIARHSTFAYKGKAIDIRQIARELGVIYVVEGSVRRATSRVRITVQLIDARDGNHLWAERFDRNLEDIFDLQDEVTKRIVTALSLALPARYSEPRRRTPKIEAYDLFVRGRVMTEQGIASTKLARPILERAIELDPDFAEAHAWLAMNLTFQWVDWGGKNEHKESMLAAADRAVSLDPSNADGYFVRGYAFTYKGDLAMARSQFELALKFNPNHVDAWLYFADLEVFDGRADAAIRAVEKALQLNPHPNTNHYWMMGFALYSARRYEEAIKFLQNDLCRGTGSQRILAAALAQAGQLDTAREVARSFIVSHPEFTVSSWARTQPFRDPRDRQHFVDGCIKAGLPE